MITHDVISMRNIILSIIFIGAIEMKMMLIR